ncbi:MAG: FAD-dependent oxidoreductase [Bacillota bacterium]|nr:FAD-dependent oxidoreductase [Bacillota bacterium]
MKNVDLVIIGGGAAGMAAAYSARNHGVKDILIIERNYYLGGVLRQCIHNGFGLHRFNEDLTGVEFARRYRLMCEEEDIQVMLNSFVIEMNRDKVITVVNPDEGLLQIKAKAIILAMGCRERTRNNLLIPGARGAGIMTAGTAQKYVNINGYLPGNKVVILGSGDIGLIMARQFVMEGIEVKAVVEIMPYSSGLPRNMKQCIEDFDIPVYFNSTISDIHGEERVDGVTVARVDENRNIIEGSEFHIDCDLLMISAGLIPENELSEQAGVLMSDSTRGPLVTEDYQTTVEGVFACGNVLHVHDLVDFVSEEAELAGERVARYLDRKASSETPTHSVLNVLDTISLVNGYGIGGIVPQRVRRDLGSETVTFMFRPTSKFKDVRIMVDSVKDGCNMPDNKADRKNIFEKKGFALTPGEMIRLDIPKEIIAKADDKIVIYIQEESMKEGENE